MFDVIILGATFAAAGLAQHYKQDCLVIEASHRAGYEFYGTLQEFPLDTYLPKQPAACALREKLMQMPVIHGSHPAIYPYFQDCHIRFGTQVAAIRREKTGFFCTVHGSQGFVTYQAKTIVDTRCSDAISQSKTYNFLMESPALPAFSGAICKETAVPGRYLVQCQLPCDCDFPQARNAMLAIMEQFTPQQRLILSADVFDYRVQPGDPQTREGIVYFPSKAYESPVHAMEAGQQLGGSGL